MTHLTGAKKQSAGKSYRLFYSVLPTMSGYHWCSINHPDTKALCCYKTFFHLFHHSFQSEVFSCQNELFRALEACFWQLEKMKPYSSQNCFLSEGSAQNVWIWPNYSFETSFNLFHHSFQSEVFSRQNQTFQSARSLFWAVREDEAVFQPKMLSQWRFYSKCVNLI